MFDKEIYVSRREILKRSIGGGFILLLGNDEVGMNYGSNYYPYRQDSTFLYYTGIDKPGFALLIDMDEGEEYIIGDDPGTDDMVWTGPQVTITEWAELAGIRQSLSLAIFESKVKGIVSKGQSIKYLKPYRHKQILYLSSLFRAEPGHVLSEFSQDLTKVVVDQRSVKSEEEIAELHKAADITGKMHIRAMELTRPGIVEREIMSALLQTALAEGAGVSFPCIVSRHGEVLHNQRFDNTLRDGDLLLVDCGAESLMHYAGDMTRTFPVSATFSSRQRDVYEIVLKAMNEVIMDLGPSVSYKEMHSKASHTIVDGLSAIGLMQGDSTEAVEKGAHALFFPHGLGHMLGLDVHDMENLGEEFTGYDDTVERSSQFGLNFLRLAKKLQPGYVLTVEPGIYFIPALIDIWKSENKFSEFINYDALEEYRDFGGIRIEEDFVIRESGSELLGPPIPKEITDVEQLRNTTVR